VLRLFPERLHVTLAPTAPGQPWPAALAALHPLAWPRGARLTVVLSNAYVRYALVPWSASLSGTDEEEAYVRHHFAKVHGDRARAWALRWDDGGEPRLACAIDAGLLEDLQAACAQGGAKLLSVQPALMAAVNRWRRAVPRRGAWLVLAEPERSCVALSVGGEWRAVQTGRGSWRALLERERVRQAADAPRLALIAGAKAEPDGSGWQFRALAA